MDDGSPKEGDFLTLREASLYLGCEPFELQLMLQVLESHRDEALARHASTAWDGFSVRFLWEDWRAAMALDAARRLGGGARGPGENGARLGQE